MAELNNTENLCVFLMSHKVPPHLISVMSQGNHSVWTIDRHISKTASRRETQTSQLNTTLKFLG